MKYKIVFLDVDGTLFSHKTKCIPSSALEAIKKAKENGIIICLATGRNTYLSSQTGLFDIIDFDYFNVCNGTLVHDKNFNLIKSYQDSIGEISIYDIYNDLKGENPDLSFATVYRNLKLLEELGKIKRVYVGDNVERYDACCSDHAHFVCTCCKKVIDITGEKEMMVNKFKELNDAYSVSRVCLTLEGVCPDCKQKGD